MHSREDRRRIADPCTIVQAHEQVCVHAQDHNYSGQCAYSFQLLLNAAFNPHFQVG